MLGTPGYMEALSFQTCFVSRNGVIVILLLTLVEFAKRSCRAMIRLIILQGWDGSMLARLLDFEECLQYILGQKHHSNYHSLHNLLNNETLQFQ